jgi:pimeloyl-ACP methyl ester carboxylesterase
LSFFSSYDGTKLAYTEVGSGPLLICLPGGPGRAAGYLEDLGGLDADHTLVRLDGRATGRSEVPADPATLRFDRLADDVEALREHLGQERVDLLAHSAGTIVAQAWASAHPERVAHLVLVTPADGLQGGGGADVPAIRAGRSAEPWFAAADAAQRALADAPASQRAPLERATRPFFYGRWDEAAQQHAAGADTQSSKRAVLGFSAGGESVDVPAIVTGLGRVRSPVLVVGGERDGLTGVSARHVVAASFPHAQTVVLPGAGHFPWVDEPAAFAEAVRAFLAHV